MFDSHIHSSFSGDSDMPAEVACETAINLGLKGIAFTDHLDYDFPYFEEIHNIDFCEYSHFMDDLKDRYRNRIKVLKGIEVGLQPHVLDETLKVIESYDFDYVIASVHVIDKLDPYRGDFYVGKTRDEAYTRYLKEVYNSVCSFENYDITGHIGYIRRYGDFTDRSLDYFEYSEIIDASLKKIISCGKGIEINTSGYRSGLGSPMPDFEIIKRYRELGGEIICLGSDAHYPEHIASNFDIGKQLLLDAGFKYTAHFEKRKPIFEKIEG